MMEWKNNFSNFKEGFKTCLWGGMWLYLFVTGTLYFYYCYDKNALSLLLKGVFWTLPLLAVMLGEFSDLKKRFFCFGRVVLLRDFLYMMAIAIWQHGFTAERSSMLARCTVAVFTVIVLDVFFRFFYHLGKAHPWILIFTLPFILSISIGLFHMWAFLISHSPIFTR